VDLKMTDHAHLVALLRDPVQFNSGMRFAAADEIERLEAALSASVRTFYAREEDGTVYLIGASDADEAHKLLREAHPQSRGEIRPHGGKGVMGFMP
jgi:hypothetical protein